MNITADDDRRNCLIWKKKEIDRQGFYQIWRKISKRRLRYHHIWKKDEHESTEMLLYMERDQKGRRRFTS